MESASHATPPSTEPLPLLVCALIVSHDCVEASRRTVASLEASLGRERMEILVVDNGSSDGSQRLDSEFPEINMLRLPHFCGMTKARNIGMRTARAEYVLLIEPGIEVEPGTVAALADRLVNEREALAVCPSVVDQASGALVSKMYRLPSAEDVAAHWDNPAALPVVTDPAACELHDGRVIFIRKHTIKGMNYLDEKFGQYWGDVEVAFQIKRAGKRIVVAPDIKVTLASGAPQGWQPTDSGDRAAFAADAANGAAVYLGKHFGFGASFGLRMKVIFGALLRALTFQDAGYQFSLFSRALSGYKIDGSANRL